MPSADVKGTVVVTGGNSGIGHALVCTLLAQGFAVRACDVATDRLLSMQHDNLHVVVDFLLGDRSRYMTGQLIHPNGGQLSW